MMNNTHSIQATIN